MSKRHLQNSDGEEKLYFPKDGETVQQSLVIVSTILETLENYDDFKKDNEDFINIYLNEPDFSGKGKRRSKRKWFYLLFMILFHYVRDFILLCHSVLLSHIFYLLSLYISCNDYILIAFHFFMWFDLFIFTFIYIYIYILFVTLFTELASYYHTSISLSMIRKVRHISFNPTGTVTSSYLFIFITINFYIIFLYYNDNNNNSELTFFQPISIYSHL